MGNQDVGGVSRGFGPGPHPAIVRSERTAAAVYDSFQEAEATARFGEQSQAFRGGETPEALAHYEKAKEHMTDIPRRFETYGTGEDLLLGAAVDDGDQPGVKGVKDSDANEVKPHQNPPAPGGETNYAQPGQKGYRIGFDESTARDKPGLIAQHPELPILPDRPKGRDRGPDKPRRAHRQYGSPSQGTSGGLRSA